MSNIVCYGSDGNILRRLYQWDINQTISIAGVPTSPLPDVHFCNRLSTEAIVVGATVSSEKIAVKVPNIFLTQAEPVTAFIYTASGTDGHMTTYAIHIPVLPRPKPSDYDYVDNSEYTDWVALSEQAVALFATLQANAVAATDNANDAADAAYSAAAVANTAAAAVTGDVIDGFVFEDEDDELYFLAQFKFSGGHPAMLCTQISAPTHSST